MLIQCESGRVMEIPHGHTVFLVDADVYKAGDVIDPQTVDVTPERPAGLEAGLLVVIDNRVEAVARVAPPH